MQDIRRRSHPGLPEWSGTVLVPVGRGAVSADSVGCGRPSAGPVGVEPASAGGAAVAGGAIWRTGCHVTCLQDGAPTPTFPHDLVESWRAEGSKGRRWRLARFRHYVLLWARCWPVRRGAPGAGGAPGPRSGVIPPLPRAGVREHHAPVGALRPPGWRLSKMRFHVREHHAPVGALRPLAGAPETDGAPRQGAPRTCRCIETDTVHSRGNAYTVVREYHAPVGALRQGSFALDDSG